MIAIGGSIGTGLFVGSGRSFHTDGPAAVVIAFSLIGSMLFTTVHALGEMAVTFPVSGASATYSTRFLDLAWGLTMGWNYTLSWLIAFPLDVTVFWVLIVAINFFGVKDYGEAEFVFSLIKVLAIIGFIILGIGGYSGAKYWYDPGSFAAGFKDLCSVVVTAVFAFNGTEVVGLAAAETSNPRKILPKATEQVFWRISLFHIVALTVTGCLVPYNVPRLLEANTGLPSVMNTVILIGVLSVGNSFIYTCSRTLCALTTQGQAPCILAYVSTKSVLWPISMCHARLRPSSEILPFFTSAVGVYGSYYGIILNFLVLVANFGTAVWPINGTLNAIFFFQAYLAVPVALGFYASLNVIKGSSIVRAKVMDIISGRREIDPTSLQGFLYRTYSFWC
ncbi:hypothetical protein NADFUDRAFT_72948 [Nadsonia fulvescens var. elongata DSM 6958]|uniref:Amino acid permease/ SLC12A domain-containing protein n=1 Tax=Nadsonia fulvescens var. elongata DSM 6958 TaxID=857566 RepID=A0A1E3PN92_9ASCO|nr:hypothetical protein NADFUDRAFT_72948 [Nadsonia fulvescens var. elongata DSM 6958]